MKIKQTKKIQQNFFSTKDPEYITRSETNVETSQTLTNRIHFPHKMDFQALFFSCKIKTMHIPRKMNAFLLTCLYLPFTYVQMSLESPLQALVCFHCPIIIIIIIIINSFCLGSRTINLSGFFLGGGGEVCVFVWVCVCACVSEGNN